MKGINGELNYKQSATECYDKLISLCNKWEMDDSDKETMTFEVDDYFMSTIYSTVRLLNKMMNYEDVDGYKKVIGFALEHLHDADLRDMPKEDVEIMENLMDKLGIEFVSQL